MINNFNPNSNPSLPPSKLFWKVILVSQTSPLSTFMLYSIISQSVYLKKKVKIFVSINIITIVLSEDISFFFSSNLSTPNEVVIVQQPWKQSLFFIYSLPRQEVGWYLKERWSLTSFLYCHNKFHRKLFPDAPSRFFQRKRMVFFYFVVHVFYVDNISSNGFCCLPVL